MSRYYEYGQDILQDVLSRGNELTALSGTVSDFLTATKGYIQRVYHDILLHAPWPWALKDPPGVLTILKKVTGTATVTEDSTAVTLSVAKTPSMAGRWFMIDGEQKPYRIITHVSGTVNVVLDATYCEDSGSSSYTIFKDEYELATDCLKIWRAWNRNSPDETLDIIDPSEMHVRFPSRVLPGTHTRRLTVLRGYPLKVRVKPWPDSDNITLEYEYTKAPGADLTWDEASTDIPVFPLEDRHVIADAALVLLYLDKNDPRAEEMSGLVQAKVNQMMATYINPGKVRLYVPRGQGLAG